MGRIPNHISPESGDSQLNNHQLLQTLSFRSNTQAINLKDSSPFTTTDSAPVIICEQSSLAGGQCFVMQGNIPAVSQAEPSMLLTVALIIIAALSIALTMALTKDKGWRFRVSLFAESK